jgi:hypothetical protein
VRNAQQTKNSNIQKGQLDCRVTHPKLEVEGQALPTTNPPGLEKVRIILKADKGVQKCSGKNHFSISKSMGHSLEAC